MADRLRTVLDFITVQYLVRDDLRGIDFDAEPSETGDAIESDKREAIKRENERTGEIIDAFRDGLALAYRAHQAGQREIALDDRDPAEDAMADALIHALVRTDLAASTTEETAPRHYVYRIAVDWERLGTVARAAGVDFDETMGEFTT